MIRRYWFASLLLVAELLLSACQPIMPQEIPLSPEQPGLRPDAPQYANHGPFWVGYKPLVIGEGTDHPLEAGLWYPALNPKGAKEEITYPITLKFPTEALKAPSVIYGHALLDAAINDAQAPYPLVVFSHGFATNATWYSTLIEHYTSYGFIVLAPEHMEKFDPDWSELWSASIDRPRDIKQTLDYAETLNAPDGEMAGLIDMQHVAVVGHSYGGYTALAMAGAQYDLAAYNARCDQLAPDDPNAFLCAPLVPKEAEMAARAGLDPMPEGLWPSFGDPRVTAILPMAGDSYLFDKVGLSKITIPMMAIGGTADTATPYEWGSKPAYENASSAEKTLVTLIGAEHTITTLCDGIPWMSETPFYGWICFDPVWDKDRGMDLISHFSTAFLLDTLKGDADAAAALARENVAFPGVEYETTAYAGSSTADTVAPLANIAEIEALIATAMAENEIPGMALGIVNGSEIAYTNGFGVERVGAEKPVTLHSVFGTGSIGKTATAMAIMQLVAQGKIDLDAPVTDYLPYFRLADERYTMITIRHLITHRSGLPEVENWFPEPVEYDDGALERYVQSLSNVELLFTPDEQWSYSGNGFIVLADVVAKTSGQTFEEYLRDQIIVPLGMSDTLLIIPEADQVLVVGNHVRNEQGDVVVSETFPYRRQFAPTGPLNSSITDMTRYAAAQLGRGELEGTRILPAESYDLMWEPISELDFDFGPVITPLFANYGMGWTLGEIDGHRIAAHFGFDEGFSGAMLLAPDEDIAVVLISNYFDDEEFNLSVWATAIETMRMMLTLGE